MVDCHYVRAMAEKPASGRVSIQASSLHCNLHFAWGSENSIGNHGHYFGILHMGMFFNFGNSFVI